MQTKMFVFIGVPNSKPAPTTDELQYRLQFQFSTTDKFLQFTKKDKLLTSRYNDVSYYVSILDSKNELKDWLQMAKDFELSSDTTSLKEKATSDRYNKLRITKPNLYSENEYPFWRKYAAKPLQPAYLCHSKLQSHSVASMQPSLCSLAYLCHSAPQSFTRV